MLTQVEVRTSQGDLLSLPLEDISNGFAVEGIEGLGPVKATIVSSSFAQRDGSQYHSSSLGNRNITMSIELLPDWATTTVRDLRTRLYSVFMPKSEVSLRFYDSDGLIVNISGRVESCEPNIFAKEPTVDISIICFDPDFLDLNTTVVSTTTTQGAFEKPVPYIGNADTGVLFEMTLNRTLSQFTLHHRTPDGVLNDMTVVGNFISGDKVSINTVVGSKTATLMRAGSVSSILYGVSAPVWMQLKRGDNSVRIFDAGALIPYTITYTNRYGGL